jgi:hypothetical protein
MRRESAFSYQFHLTCYSRQFQVKKSSLPFTHGQTITPSLSNISLPERWPPETGLPDKLKEFGYLLQMNVQENVMTGNNLIDVPHNCEFAFAQEVSQLIKDGSQKKACITWPDLSG